MAKSKNPAELVIFGNPRKKKGRNPLLPSSKWRPGNRITKARHSGTDIDEVRDALRGGGSEETKHKLRGLLAKRTGKPFLYKGSRYNPDGLTIKYLPANQAYALMWHSQILRIFNDKKDAKAEMDYLLRKRGNPEELTQAVELYETFQGKRAENIIEAQRSAAMRMDYAALGSLLAIGLYTEDLKIPSPDHWEDYPHLKFARDVTLASNAEGSQLYAIGGNQDVSQAAAQIPDVDTSKDLLDLGPIAFVVYFARKSVDNFQPTEYMHQFDTPRPSLGFDQIKTEIFFAGGRYSVEAPGIVH